MIFCVIPEAMADELVEQLTRYYADDPNVKVIVDRRRTERREPGPNASVDQKRTIRDRRRPRVPGEFPTIDLAVAT